MFIFADLSKSRSHQMTYRFKLLHIIPVVTEKEELRQFRRSSLQWCLIILVIIALNQRVISSVFIEMYLHAYRNPR